MRPGSFAAALALALSLLCGCVLSDVDLSDKACPCAEGWSCDESRDVCVPDDHDAAAPDASGPDGGDMDGGAPDAGPADAGPTDAGADGGAPDAGGDAGADGGANDAGIGATACGDVLAGAVFCDGFEDVGLTTWSGDYGAGTIERSTSNVHRGSGALSVQTDVGEQGAVEIKGLDGLSDEVHVRGYVYIPSGFNLVDVSVMYVATEMQGFSLGVSDGERPYVYLDEGATHTTAPVLTVPRDTWTCMSARVVVSDTDGVVELRIDGDLAARQTGLDTQLTTPYSDFAAGITYSNPDGDASRVLLDDVAIGTSPLPCD